MDGIQSTRTTAVSAATIDIADAPVAHTTTSLPIPSGGVVDYTQLASLIIEIGAEMGKNARIARDADWKQQLADWSKQLQSMREQADEQFMSSLVSGFTKMGSGALTIAAGSEQIDAAHATTDAARDALKGEATQLEGKAQMVGALGELESSIEKWQADDAGIRATDADHLAEAAKKAGADDQDQIQAAREFVNKIIDMIAKIEETEGQCQSAAIVRG